MKNSTYILNPNPFLFSIGCFGGGGRAIALKQKKPSSNVDENALRFHLSTAVSCANVNNQLLYHLSSLSANTHCKSDRSLRIGTSAIHMPGSIEYSQAASTVTSVSNGIGPGTSA